MYHPWRDARRREHLNIEFKRLPDGRRGCLRGNDVTINTADGQAQRRSTITHELVHDERRVFPTDRVLRAREELRVERIAARRLIALERLVDALVWTRRTEEVAEELWVDVPMLVALVQSLTDRERDWIDAELRERGIA
ncbi:metallo-protease [Gordonia phage Powerball]|uniref:DNA binding protein n=1 Tax=Gordonia phage Powerball TaxID=2599847 RepID=A0A5J6TRT1_9CAUD|nr:metallo-protease [Gordonia phage Powerball]QFG13471.1 DNA binding protein [Gordonia phage Powerball]